MSYNAFDVTGHVVTATHYISVDIDGRMINTVLAGDVTAIGDTLAVEMFEVKMMFSNATGPVDPNSQLYDDVLNKIRELFDKLNNTIDRDISN